MGVIPCFFLLLRGAYPSLAVTAPHSVQQASCCFGVRIPSGRSRPRTASSKLPVTSGPHGLPGRPCPAQQPASFLLLRGAGHFRAPRPRTATSKLPVTLGCRTLPGSFGPEQRPASFLLLRGATTFRAAPPPNSNQLASCCFGVPRPSGPPQPRTATSKPGVCLIADTKSLLFSWLFSVHDSNCRIS